MKSSRFVQTVATSIVVLMAIGTHVEAQFSLLSDNRSVSASGEVNSSTLYSQFQAGPEAFATFNGNVNGSGETNLLEVVSSATQTSIITSNAIYATNVVGCSYSFSYTGPFGGAPSGEAVASNIFEITFGVQSPVLCCVSGIHFAGGDIFGAPTVYLGSAHHGTITSIGENQEYAWNFLGVLQSDTYIFNLDVPIDFGAFYSPQYPADHAAVYTSCALTVVPPPVILSNTMSVTASPGGIASFNIVATGDPRGGNMSYQWIFGGNNIPAATNGALVLTNLTSTQAGSYFIVVSNWAGSSTSSPAVLSLLSLNMYAGLTIAGQVGDTYQVDYRTSLTGSNWTTLTNLVLPSNPFLFIDTNSPYSPQRFYRAVVE
jgi:hypothetical protein